jgi:hypothetical protein
VSLHETPPSPKKKKISFEENTPIYKTPESLCEIEGDDNTIFFGCRGGKIIQWAIEEQRVARIYSDLTTGEIDVM